MDSLEYRIKELERELECLRNVLAILIPWVSSNSGNKFSMNEAAALLLEIEKDHNKLGNKNDE